MSHTYFISLFDPDNYPDLPDNIYKVDADTLSQAILVEWPDANVYIPPLESRYVLRWDLSEGEKLGILGGLQESLRTVSVSPGPTSSLIDFVLWFRAFIPTAQLLFLHQSSNRNSIGLNSDLTRETILRFTEMLE